MPLQQRCGESPWDYAVPTTLDFIKEPPSPADGRWLGAPLPVGKLVATPKELQHAPRVDNGVSGSQLHQLQQKLEEVNAKLHRLQQALDASSRRLDTSALQQQSFVAEVEGEWQCFRSALDRTAKDQLLASERSEKEMQRMQQQVQALERQQQQLHVPSSSQCDALLSQLLADYQTDHRRIDAVERQQQQEHHQQSQQRINDIGALVSQLQADHQADHRRLDALERVTSDLPTKSGPASSQIAELWTQLAQTMEASLWASREVGNVRKELAENQLQWLQPGSTAAAERPDGLEQEVEAAVWARLAPRIATLEDRVDSCRSDLTRANTVFAQAISTVFSEVEEVTKGHGELEVAIRAHGLVAPGGGLRAIRFTDPRRRSSEVLDAVAAYVGGEAPASDASAATTPPGGAGQGGFQFGGQSQGAAAASASALACGGLSTLLAAAEEELPGQPAGSVESGVGSLQSGIPGGGEGQANASPPWQREAQQAPPLRSPQRPPQPQAAQRSSPGEPIAGRGGGLAAFAAPPERLPPHQRASPNGGLGML